MLPFVRKQRPDGKATNDYATRSDFCVIFREQLDSLFLLALLLIGDEPGAEKCLLTAFDMCMQGNPVFKESAVSWSRRSVIKAAIRLTLRVPSDPSNPRFSGDHSNLKADRNDSLNYLLELPRFERLVFVISVLERYSDHECSLFLDCSRTDIGSARIRAFQQISKTEKSYDRNSSGAQPVADADWLECG